MLSIASVRNYATESPGDEPLRDLASERIAWRINLAGRVDRALALRIGRCAHGIECAQDRRELHLPETQLDKHFAGGPLDDVPPEEPHPLAKIQ